MAEKRIKISKDKIVEVLEMWAMVDFTASEAIDATRALERKKHLMDIAKIDFWGGVKKLYPEVDRDKAWRFEEKTQEFVMTDEDVGPSDLLKMLKNMGQGPQS